MSKRNTVQPGDLPAACRTWDDRRRAWVAKARYPTEKEARGDLGRNRTMTAYRCKAAQVGVHFHLGHPSKGHR